MHPFQLSADQLPARLHAQVMGNVGRLMSYLEQAGLTVRVSHDLAELAPIYRRSGEPLSVMADPEVHPRASTPLSTLGLILEKDGQPVGCTIQRRIWTSHLIRDMQLLRYWYGDPAETGFSASASAACIATPCLLSGIGPAWTVYSCGFFVEKLAQKKGVANALIRMAHALALATMRWDWLLARSKASVAHRYAFGVYGFNAVLNGVWLLRDEAGPAEHPHYLLITDHDSFLQQVTHPWYGDPAQPLDLAVQLRGIEPTNPAMEDAAS